jgi:hypothetical protein
MEFRQLTLYVHRAFMKLTSTVSLVGGPHRNSCLVHNLVYVEVVRNNFRTARLISSMFLLKSGQYLHRGPDYAELKEFQSVAKALAEAVDSICAHLLLFICKTIQWPMTQWLTVKPKRLPSRRSTGSW